MPARSLNVTLPPDLADMVEDKVASGAYASDGQHPLDAEVDRHANDGE